MSLRRGIIASQRGEFPPPVQCTTTLTGDIAAGLPGAQPADISGLTFSKTDSAGLFLAGSPLPGGLRPMPTGDSIVWVQVGDFTASGGNARAGFAAFTAGGAVIGAISSRTNVLLDQFDGTTGADIGRYTITESTPDPTMAIGIDADGWVYIRTSEGLVRADTLPVFEGTPTGRLVDGGGNPPTTIALLGTIDLTAGIGSASGRFWVSQAEMDLTGLSGEDWCGNVIDGPPPPPPELEFHFAAGVYDPEFFNDGVSGYDWVTTPIPPDTSAVAESPAVMTRAEFVSYVNSASSSIIDYMSDGTPIGWTGPFPEDSFIGDYNTSAFMVLVSAGGETGYWDIEEALAAAVPGDTIGVLLRSMTVTESYPPAPGVGETDYGGGVSGGSGDIILITLPFLVYEVTEASSPDFLIVGGHTTTGGLSSSVSVFGPHLVPLPGPTIHGTAGYMSQGCAVSPDGSMLLVGSNTTPRRTLFNTSDWSVLHQFAQSNPVESVAWHPDGTRYYTMEARWLREYSVADGSLIKEVQVNTSGNTNGVAVSPNGTWVIALVGTVQGLYLTSDFSPVVGFDGFTGLSWRTGYKADWSPNSAKLVISKQGNAGFAVFDTDDWSRFVLSPLPPGMSSDAIGSAARWSHDGQRLAVVMAQNTYSSDGLYVYDTDDWSYAAPSSPFDNGVSANGDLQWSPDDTKLIIGGDGAAATLRVVNSGALDSVLHESRPATTVFSVQAVAALGAL